MTTVANTIKSPAMAESLFVRKRKKKKKKGNPLVDFLTYIALRILVIFVCLFGVEANLKFARFLGRLLWKYYHRGRKRALDNLAASYPEKDRQWYETTARRCFEQIAMLTVDVIFTPRLVKKQNWRLYSRFKNAERAKWLCHERKGLLFVTAHYGNFEIIGYMLGLFGFNIYSIARPLDNPFISKYLYGVRRRVGQNIIDKKGAAELMPLLLASGAALCFIADQDAGSKGIFVDFFGRKASTYKSIALLAVTQNIPVAVGYGRRIENRFFFEIGINRIISPEEWAGKSDPLTWLTAEYTKAIEQFVRKDPSQYWWLHRRWRHRPKKELEAAGS